MLAGYRYIQNADLPTCLMFCRQDEKCTSLVYSELQPPFTGSNCRFYDNTVQLFLRKPDTPIGRSYLIILESGQRNVNTSRYISAVLNGAPFKTNESPKQDGGTRCKSACLDNPFCDALVYIDKFTKTYCSHYSRQDITNMTYQSISMPPSFVQFFV